jgi:MerR family copper efflux transcriptional regulator
MKIGELSQLTGMSKDTIRFYEKIGLLPKAKRQDNGYREYSSLLVDQIKLLNHAKSLGFSLAEIKELSLLFKAKKLNKKKMADFLSKKEKEIDEKIKQLKLFKKEIKHTLGGFCDYSEYLDK